MFPYSLPRASKKLEHLISLRVAWFAPIRYVRYAYMYVYMYIHICILFSSPMVLPKPLLKVEQLTCRLQAQAIGSIFWVSPDDFRTFKRPGSLYIPGSPERKKFDSCGSKALNFSTPTFKHMRGP